MKNKEILILPLVMVVIAAFTRLIPHYPNFTAVGAMALFSAAYIKPRILSFLIPALALFVSDLFLNNLVYAHLYPEHYSGFVLFDLNSLWVYGGFAAVVGIGFLLLRKNIKVLPVIYSSLAASVCFFLITNFGTWASSGIYPKTFAGLTACFGAGIPYFWNTMFGDLFYVGVLFGGYALVTAWTRRSALA